MDFFTYETNLPEGSGYTLLDGTHLIILSVCALLSVIYMILYRKSENIRRRSFLRSFAGIFPFILLIIRMLYILIIREDIRYELPLHMCSLAGILCFVYEIFLSKGDCKKSVFISICEQALYAICLPGVILALIYPNGTVYPPVSFISIQSFLFHTFVMIYVIICLADGLITPGIFGIVRCLIFLVMTVVPVCVIDLILDTDYMFLMRPSFGSPLYLLYERYGYTAYLSAYGALTVSVIMLMEILYVTIQNRRKKEPLTRS